METLAQGLAAACRERGVRRAFGVPGGASSLDVIDALAAVDIDFVLTHGETAAALMAAVGAELGSAPGVVVTGVGPGAASAVNGIAYAALERAPVLLVSDALAEPAPGHHALHQRFDQQALFAPLVKAYARPGTGTGRGAIDALLDSAAAHPAGPVQLDLTSAAAGGTGPLVPPGRERTQAVETGYDLVALAEASELLADASIDVFEGFGEQSAGVELTREQIVAIDQAQAVGQGGRLRKTGPCDGERQRRCERRENASGLESAPSLARGERRGKAVLGVAGVHAGFNRRGAVSVVNLLRAPSRVKPT